MATSARRERIERFHEKFFAKSLHAGIGSHIVGSCQGGTTLPTNKRTTMGIATATEYEVAANLSPAMREALCLLAVGGDVDAGALATLGLWSEQFGKLTTRGRRVLARVRPDGSDYAAAFAAADAIVAEWFANHEDGGELAADVMDDIFEAGGVPRNVDCAHVVDAIVKHRAAR